MNYYYKLIGSIAFIALTAGCGAKEESCHLVGSSQSVMLRPPAVIREVSEFDVRLCLGDLCNTTTMVATESGFEVKGCKEECDPQSQEIIALPYVPVTSKAIAYAFTARDADQHTIMERSGMTEMGETASSGFYDQCGVKTLTSLIDLSAVG